MDIQARPVVQHINRPAQLDNKEIESTGHVVEPANHTSVCEKSDAIVEAQTIALDDEQNFPEGGLRAWLVVAGAWLCLFPSFGLMVSIGPIQDYLTLHQLARFSPRDVGWIPSVFVYLALALGIWIGSLFDRYGSRWLALIGSVGYVIMVFLLAECRLYYQFILCLGVFGGLTGAMLATTSLACVAHWFKERRGLTQGIAMIGSSFGGLTIPLILRETLPRWGFAWSIRLIGFIFAACLAAGNVLMRARLPPRRTNKVKTVSLSIFADSRFSLLTCAVFCFEVTLFGSLGIIPTYTTVSTNFPTDTGFYLIAVMNGVSSIGRLVTGYASDKFGRFNTLLISAIIALIFMLALWLPLGQSNLGALYGFIAIYGFCTGCWMALVPSCLGQLCEAHEFGRYYGTSYFLASLSTLICVPISGELVKAAGAQAMVGFYCAVLSLGIVAFASSRSACLGWRWDWSTKI